MQPDANRLKMFHDIYAARSVVAVAQKRNITPSAVSQQLKKLEHEIKVPLFTRLHKKLVPTVEAHRLFDLVHPLFKDLETALGTIRQARVKPSGVLRVGAPEEFGKAYLPGVCASFRREYPEVTFALTLGDPTLLLPMVGDGNLDFALVDVFLTQSRQVGDLGIYSIEPLFDENVILACSGRYWRNSLEQDASFANLSAHAFLSYRANASELYSWFKHHHGKTLRHPHIVMTVDSVQAVISCIRHHMGMGIIVSHLVEEDLRKGAIVPISSGRQRCM